MGNNLDRHIAIVCADSGNELAHDLKDLIQTFGASATVFQHSRASEMDAADFDAIVFIQVTADQLKTAKNQSGEFKKIEAIVREMNTEFKPIAAVGASISVLSAIFRDLEVASVHNDDYVSDRDHKVLTTLGSAAGIRKMLRELVEMA